MPIYYPPIFSHLINMILKLPNIVFQPKQTITICTFNVERNEFLKQQTLSTRWCQLALRHVYGLIQLLTSQLPQTNNQKHPTRARQLPHQNQTTIAPAPNPTSKPPTGSYRITLSTVALVQVNRSRSF